MIGKNGEQRLRMAKTVTVVNKMLGNTRNVAGEGWVFIG